MQTESLRNRFLIAMPMLADPNFFHSVTYLCEHDEHGAFGIVINQPLEFTLAEIATQMQLTTRPGVTLTQSVFSGGPVETERGFVLHPATDQWAATVQVSDQLALTTSSDIIEALAQGQGPNKSLIALGYAGWGAGQLEQELADNAWLAGPARADVIFDTPVAMRWQQAAALLGVDIHRLSNSVGHA
jgi:putative transcriptional regulator